MSHDYAPDLDYFNNNVNSKIWNWFEIQDSDINLTVEQCNLKPFMQEKFQEVVWVCKIKK